MRLGARAEAWGSEEASVRRCPCHPVGRLYEYQKKGDADGGVCMIIKTKGIERWERGGPFELDLTTLVSLARVVLASQEI